MPPDPAHPRTYLDHAASTPMRPEAIEAMLEVARDVPGNPSGQHGEARRARRLLDDARDRIAAVVGCDPGEVVFTSGGTEADDLAIRGVAAAVGVPALCLATDHHAAIDPVLAVGGRVVPLHGPGRWPSVEALAAALGTDPSASVVSVAVVNNEVGVVERVHEVAEVVRARSGAAVHLDAVAAAGWLDLPPLWAGADLLSLSAHKVGAPLGAGALVVRSGTPLAPQLRGAQERERRGGTPNLAGAVALGVALELGEAEREAKVARVGALRERLRAGLLAALGSAVRETVPGGDDVAVAPHIVHLCAEGVHRDALLFRLDADGVAASAGASCASGAPEPSHVVRALGVPVERGLATLRLSLGWTTTEADVERALAVVPAAIRDLAGTADLEASA